MKKTKINSKTFIKEVTDYQNRIFYSNRGQCLYSAGLELGIELTAEQVSYIHTVMVVSDNNFIDYGMGYVDIPVQLLFTMITPFAVACYSVQKNKIAHSYMAGVTDRCIVPLKDIILFKSKYIGKCRKFAILDKFVEEYHMAQQASLYEEIKVNTFEEWDYFKKARWGEGFAHLDRLNEITVKAVSKARNSQFVFDAEYFASKEGKAFIKERLLIPGNTKQNMYALDSLNSTLNFIDRKSSKPQYHTPFHLQDSGRIHTVGGCIQMPKWFRNRFIRAVDSNNIRIEFDLKCAQLLILCELMNQPALKEKILAILEKEGSLWGEIGIPSLDKRIKKIVIYSFCFGAELRHIPFLASKEARRLNFKGAIDKKVVDRCLKGLLEPLVEARELWLKEYKTANIIKSKDPKLVDNALGYKFSLNKKAIEYYGGYTSCVKDASTKVGSQLMAHLAQGMEQFYIQNLIANHVENNILMWAYDGFVLEIPPNQVNSVISNLSANSLAPLEYEVLTSS